MVKQSTPSPKRPFRFTAHNYTHGSKDAERKLQLKRSRSITPKHVRKVLRVPTARETAILTPFIYPLDEASTSAPPHQPSQLHPLLCVTTRPAPVVVAAKQLPRPPLGY